MRRHQDKWLVSIEAFKAEVNTFLQDEYELTVREARVVLIRHIILLRECKQGYETVEKAAFRVMDAELEEGIVLRALRRD